MTYEESVIFFIVVCVISILVLLRHAMIKTKQLKGGDDYGN